MSRDSPALPPQPDGKRRKTTATAHSSAVSRPPARLLQLSAALVDLIHRYLPWWERLLHVSHVNRRLAPALRDWNECDHVRLSEELLAALEQNVPSAVHCCHHVQSLCVERRTDAEVFTVHDEDSDSEDSPEDEALPLSRLRRFLSARRGAQPHPSIPPFGNLRSLVATTSLFQCLRDSSALPHLHSLSLGSAGKVDEESRHAEQRLLREYLATLPPLRRLRIERVRVAYESVFALPLIEHLDIRGAYMVNERPVAPPSSPHLRRLLLHYTGKLGRHDIQPHELFAALASTPLQQLGLSATLSNVQLSSLTTLQSLTALELQCCRFRDANPLGCLVSDDGEPLLLNLRRFVVDGSNIDEHRGYRVDEGGAERQSTIPPYLSSYGRQLQHLRLSVTT